LVAGYRRLGSGVDATARSISPSKDQQVLAIAGDIRDRATAQKVVAAAKERFGRVDTLVNNAGIFIAKPFSEYTQEDFDVVTGTRNLSRPPEPSQVRSGFSDLRNGQRELTLPAPFGTLLPSRTGAATHVD
jgi:NAD(P)-dependent dehydrogenase (short-subunit alcohol dehydrogenase family)